MKNLYFNDFEDLACSVSDTYASLKDEGFDDIAIIAKYEEAKYIIKNLLCIGYDVHSIEIHDYLWDNYDAEFVISLYDNKVWCEPFLRENGYINEESPVIYILDNCSSKVIPHCKGKIVYEVSVGIDEDNCNNHSECACKKDIHVEADGDMHGFSVNHSGENGWSSYSFYSTDISLVNKEFKEVKELLNVCM